MSMSFNDLDVDLQRSVFAAITILCLVLCLALVTFLHYALIGLTALASGYMAFKLFVQPFVQKIKNKSKG